MSDACATPGLLSVDDALARLLAAAQPVADTETVPLTAALDRVLATDVLSRVDVPPADNSAMDGYALRLADLQAASGHRLPVSQRVPAGHVPAPLAAGTAARIFTGAEIPPGADTVVMQEDCNADGEVVTVNAAVVAQLAVGDNVRPRGQDMAAGSVAVTAGEIINPARLGVIAAAGHATVNVRRRLRVAMFSTGDELLEPGAAPAPGRIFNSNRYALLGYLARLGCEVIDLGVVGDTRDATVQALREAGTRADLLLTTGGASVGEEDHLKAALATVGRVDLWKVAIKPGKPLLFGSLAGEQGDIPVLGLPGNPVSVAVTLLVFGVPFMRALQGVRSVPAARLAVPAGFRTRKAGGRTEFLRVRLEHTPAGPRLQRYPNQSSGVLTSMAWADGLAMVPAGTVVDENQPVVYLPFSVLLGGG